MHAGFFTALPLHCCRYNRPLSSLFNGNLFELLAGLDTYQSLAQCEISMLYLETNETAKMLLTLKT